MNKIILSILSVFLIQCALIPGVQGAIPITEKSDAVVSKEGGQTKLNNKVSKLKLRVAKKLIAKRYDHEDKTLAIVLAILLPFVGVAVWQDGITKDFWITLLLTALLYVPGLIYALTIIFSDSR